MTNVHVENGGILYNMLSALWAGGVSGRNTSDRQRPPGETLIADNQGPRQSPWPCQ